MCRIRQTFQMACSRSARHRVQYLAADAQMLSRHIKHVTRLIAPSLRKDQVSEPALMDFK
jgi:hypothetical protein